MAYKRTATPRKVTAAVERVRSVASSSHRSGGTQKPTAKVHYGPGFKAVGTPKKKDY